MADPFSVAGSGVGVVSLGISVCQGLVNYYSTFKGQDDEVDEMVGKVERLTDLLETLQHRLSSPRYRHSVSVEKVEQNIVACAAALKKLDEILSKCTQESTVEDLRHTLRAISKRMLYPFKQKTLQDLSATVSQCQRDLTTALQILQIDQTFTMESSNAAILENTATTRDIVDINSQEVRAMREDIQRLMKVAVPALVLSSMRPQLQGNAENTATTVLNMSSASLQPEASEQRTIMSPKSYLLLCRCRARTKLTERQLRLGPVTLIRTSKSRVEHNKNCQYFVPGGQEEGVGLKFHVGIRSRRWNIMAALNYNHAVGAFSINPTLLFKATVPDDHPLFLVAEDIVRGKRSFESGLRSIQLLFQNGEAAPSDVNVGGVNVLLMVLIHVWVIMDGGIAIGGAFQERARQLTMALLALGVNVNEIVEGFHILDIYLAKLIMVSDRSDDFSFVQDLRDRIAMHRDCDYNPGKFMELAEVKFSPYDESPTIIEAVKKDEYLGNELGFNSLCRAVLRKSLGDIECILSKSPSAISSSTVLKRTVLHLAADWPTGMAALLSRGGRSLVHKLDLAEQSPLEHACKCDCASAVKLLLEADSYIDLELMCRLEEQSKWELFQIFVEELSHRRSLLRQLAENELHVDRYRELEIPVEHPMNDFKTVVVLAELEKNAIQTPQALAYYGITEIPELRLVNVFGSAIGNTVNGANIMHDAGFLLEPNVHIYQEVQLRLHGQCVRLHGAYWPRNSTLAQRLDIVLWVLERGVALSDLDLHHLFSPRDSSLAQYCWSEFPIFSYGDQVELLSQLLSSPLGRQHACPCCIDVCFPVLTALSTTGKSSIFAELLRLLEACKIDLGSQFWVWAMPRLIHSILFEACSLTHSNYCCKGKGEFDEDDIEDEDDIKEKQEGEEHIRSRLSTLTEELAAEYQESSMLLSDFLRDRVVGQALELVHGEVEASPEDRKRLREIGVVLEEESDGDGDGDGDDIANDG